MATAAAVNRFLGMTFPRARQINSWEQGVYSQGFMCRPAADRDLDTVKVAYSTGEDDGITSSRQKTVERAHWLRQYQEVLEGRYDVQFADSNGELVLVVSDRVAAKPVKQEQGAQ